jgi:aryl sulfotransferase
LVSYLGQSARDGREAVMSFLNHMRNLDPDTFVRLAMSAPHEGIDLDAGGGLPPVDDIHAFFAWCMNDNPMWFDHVRSFWAHVDEPNVLFVHFNDMKADLDGQMRRVAAFLDIDLDDDQWPAVVARCTFEAMKARSDEISDFAGFVGGAESFLSKGTNGRWRDVLTTDELALFDARCQELLLSDAFAWTTSGQAALRI